MDARVTVRAVELAFEQAGDGDPPLIWGHGLTSSRAAEQELPLLDMASIASTRRLVRYDARGHGESGITEEVGAYGWGEMAADQLALADVLGIDRYVAGGASMGAATALYAAVAAPARVAALVLVIPPTAWDTRAAQRELYENMADVVERRGVELLVRGAAQMPPPDPFVGDVRWRESGARPLISAIEVPTLVLAWTGDSGHPVSTARELVRLIPDARLRLASTRDDLDRWTGEVSAFLAGL